MAQENHNEKSQNEDKPEKRDFSKWGANVRWGHGQPPPTSEQKKAGWAKRKRNQELARMLLGMNFTGTVALTNKDGTLALDANGKIQLIDGPFKQRLLTYFQLGEDQMAELSNEAAIMLRQIGEAIEKGDQAAAAAIFERAYGKPKQQVMLEDEEGNKPQFVTYVVNALPSGDDMPDIPEAEIEPNENESGTEDITPENIS